MKPIPTWETVVGVNHVPDTGYEKAMQEEIDALRERLAALEVVQMMATDTERVKAQKPVAWGWLVHKGVYDTICPDEHDRHEGKYTVPLYLAAGAKP